MSSRTSTPPHRLCPLKVMHKLRDQRERSGGSVGANGEHITDVKFEEIMGIKARFKNASLSHPLHG
jgi:hypothetical protein